MNRFLGISIFTAALISSNLATPARSADALQPIGLNHVRSHGPPGSGYWGDLRVPTIDNSGNVIYRAFFNDDVADGGLNSAYRTSDDRLMARVNDQAPGLPEGVVFQNLTNLHANPQGPAGFIGYVNNAGSTFSLGIWAENPARELRLVALSGNAAPGFAAGTTFSPFSDVFLPVADNGQWRTTSKPFSINARGETAFYNRVNQPGDPPTAEGIWSEGGGQGLRLVARTGMSVPQFSPGATIAAMAAPNETVRINDAGAAAFLALAIDPDYLGGGGIGLFVDDPKQGLSVAARSSQQAPGRPDTRFGGLSFASINNAGQVVFVAEQLAGEPAPQFNYGIWSGSPDDLQLVAETGGPAPGVGGFFSELQDLSPGFSRLSSRPVLNGMGQVAFVARFTGPGVNESNDSGIWIKDPNGALRLVAREGESATNQKLLDDLLSDPAHLLLNNRGQIAVMTHNGIWATDIAGQLHNIVHLGDELPIGSGFSEELSSGDAKFFGMSQSTGGEDGLGTGFNDRGEIVFYAQVNEFNAGIYRSRAVAVPEATGASLILLGMILLAARRRPTLDRFVFAAI